MPARPLWRFAAAFAFTLPWFAGSVLGQCQPAWQVGPAAPGPDDQIHCLAELPNGDVVAGGRFLVADHQIANHVARWNGSQWSALGSGTNGEVFAVAVLSTGDVVVGGQFTSAGGVAASNLARWDGTAWHDLGGGTNGVVHALQALPGGELAIAGNFTTSGAVATNRLSRWNGSTFTTFGTQPNWTTPRRALARTPNGDLFVGGASGGSLGLFRFDGTNWSTIGGTSSINATIYALAATPSGDVYIGGAFSLAAALTSPHLVRFDGTSIQPVGNGRPQAVFALAMDGTDLLATRSQSGVRELERWNGVAWTPIGDFTGYGSSSILRRSNGSIAVATTVSPDGIAAEFGVLEWNGAAYARLGAPKPPLVQTFATLPNGDMIVGGDFTSIGGVAARFVARWDGSAWHPLGLGVDNVVTAVTAAPDGSVVVAGFFTEAGGAPANRIARWNGSTWTTLGGGLGWPPSQLAYTTDGSLYSCGLGSPSLNRWDGATWTPVPGVQTHVTRMAAHPDGRLVVVGGFTASLNGLHTYANGTWTGLPPFTGSATSVLVRANGNIVASGFLAINGVSVGVLEWNGSTWLPVGGGSPGITKAVVELPDGDLVAAESLGYSANFTSVLRRWHGGTWTTFATANRDITWLGASNRGELFASGVFTAIEGLVSASFGMAIATCPASVVPFGAGCAGGAGPVTLSTLDRPWLGSTFDSEAVGMTPLSLALHAVGTTPFAAPLPLGAPGCSQLVDPLFLGVLFPANGRVAAPLAVPNSAGLVGLVVRTQVIGLELDAALALVRTTSSNALLLTIGAL
ncbi:MAG: delta-60 repeat domain-containing protein [Planctomycetes bacterium]|nr:delta-60 repeat domain-containing protein [Planctomycetota bacterium]